MLRENQLVKRKIMSFLLIAIMAFTCFSIITPESSYAKVGAPGIKSANVKWTKGSKFRKHSRYRMKVIIKNKSKKAKYYQIQICSDKKFTADVGRVTRKKSGKTYYSCERVYMGHTKGYVRIRALNAKKKPISDWSIKKVTIR